MAPQVLKARKCLENVKRTITLGSIRQFFLYKQLEEKQTIKKR